MQPDADTIVMERSTIFVRGLSIDARVGVHVHERGDVQRLLVDVELDVPMPVCDNLAATFDYVQAVETVRRTAMSRHFDLIETFAREIGRTFLEADAIRQVFVRITKPSALAGLASATGVELLLGRDG